MNWPAIIATAIVLPPTLLLMGLVVWYARAVSKRTAELDAQGWESVACPLMTGPVMVPPSHPMHSTQRKKAAP